ncbi:MAG TPA: neuraminidase-like domain-containing protein, partial [Chloroflexota bacterium]|nr:neuraminidase-like domain-containing protein [Chloroflexota bacterium]
APAGASLFDRLFNPPSYVAADGAFPKPAAQFVHPAFRHATPAAVDPALPRLLTGLAVDLDGLAVLARHLAKHLAQESSTGFDPNAPNDEDRYFLLSAPNLTLLYRHARLARLLGVSIDDLFELLGFLGLDHVEGRSDLLALLDVHGWWRQSGYRLDDIAVATGQPPRDIGRYPDTAVVAAQVVAAAARGLTFTDTVFAVVLGTAEQGSRDLIAANPTVIEAAADGAWRLAAGIDLESVPVTVPATATVPTPPAGSRLVTTAEVRQALRPYLAAEVLARGLGTALSLATDKVVALATLAHQSLTDSAVVKAVRGDGPIGPLAALVSAVRPLAVAFATPAWDAVALNFVGQHQALFDTENLPHMAPDAMHPDVPFLSLPQLRALSTYARLAQPQPGATPDAATVNPEDIRSVLTAFDAGLPGFPSNSDAAMARVLNVPSGLVVGLRGRVTLPTVAAPALDQLDRAAQLAAALGVDGETFGALVSDDYDLLSHAADALVAVLGARHTDETTRAARLDEAEEPVREAKREALAGYLIHSITPKVWNTLDDLYQYFLIDVEAGGCSTTSRVVAATMTAQLYVYRAIMNLEQDNLPASDPNHVALRMPAAAAAEWEWRRNFRVWQANRQVFKSPENYLEPDLRDD